jgi:uncharacterized SAM-binding protein YcdF (DUF218 family)
MAAFVLLTLTCMPGISYLAVGSLEWHYPRTSDNSANAQAIVVLGGSMRSSNGDAVRDQLADDTLRRCLRAIKIYRDGPARLIAVSGGKVQPSVPGPPLAHAMRDYLVAAGVKESDVIIEVRSRSTHENAVETRKLLASRGIDQIVLVTDALHMYRAERCFRRQGFEVFPSGCAHKASNHQWSIYDFIPSASAADELNQVAHEWLGVIWYRIHDRIES